MAAQVACRGSSSPSSGAKTSHQWPVGSSPRDADINHNDEQRTYANTEEMEEFRSSPRLEGAQIEKRNGKSKGKKQEARKLKKKDKEDKRKGKKKDSKVHQAASSQKTGESNDKNRTLVEELKLFQNNQLLKQQDPMEHLQRQLHQLMSNDDDHDKAGDNWTRGNLGRPNEGQPDAMDRNNLGPVRALSTIDSENRAPRPMDDIPLPGVNLNGSGDDNYYGNLAYVQSLNEQALSLFRDTNEDFNTVKKGVLWQQQHYEKFHQRIFNRWKKRYFILTTHYLVCLKRSNSKVGQSEMGKFLYKTALSDVLKIERSKPNKSDKGPIILHFNGQFNLHLWCKRNLDDWMFMLEESILRLRTRRLHKIPAKISPINDNISQDNGLAQTNALMLLSHKTNTEDSSNGIVDKTEKLADFYENVNGRRLQEDDGMLASNKDLDGDSRGSNGGQSLRDEKLDQDPSCASIGKIQESETERSQQIESVDSSSSAELNNRQTDADSSAGGQTASDRRNSIELHEEKGKEKEEKQEEEVHLLAEAGKAEGVEIEPSLSVSQITTKEPDGECQSSAVIYDPSSTSNDGANPRDGHSSSTEYPDAEPQPRVRTSLANNNSSNNNKRLAPTDQKLDAGATEAGKALPAQNGPRSLIRRDDSWQSLVSLTRIGKTPVWQRHEPTPDSIQATDEQFGPELELRARGRLPLASRLLESSVTPIRAPMLRHNSAAAASHHMPRRRLGPLPPIGGQLQSASFELTASGPGNGDQSEGCGGGGLPLNLGTRQQQARQLSYQQNLLRLQLMHQSRHNDDPNNPEIYGPESTLYGGLYGYSSMRSNLKSAASEFAFIRPVSLVHQPRLAQHHEPQSQQQNEQQSMMPHQSGTFQRDRLPVAHEQRSSRLIPRLTDELLSASDVVSPSSCLSPLARQFLVNPMTGERMLNQQLLANGGDMPAAAGPLRELPLKPSKRRAQAGDSSAGAGSSKKGVPKSSSLSSSIASFLRRAFSRRSSREAATNLPASCSSSMGAFEQVAYANRPLVQSAFSTGSKSIVDTSADRQRIRDRQVAGQSPRMIDMIEAFAERTQLNVPARDGRPMSSGKAPAKGADAELPHPTDSPSGRQQRMMAVNQFGSPLHKSNSISTTMGLSAGFLYENAVQSPMASRAAAAGKMAPGQRQLASAHQSPRTRDPLFELEPGALLSPRAGRPHEPLPRPISLYGQPSMIAQVMNRDDYGPIGGHNSDSGCSRRQQHSLGSHRNSLQNFSHLRHLHNQSFEMPSNSRRHYQHLLSKGPFPLDTTNEVAEELASPVGLRDLGINLDLRPRARVDRSDWRQSHPEHQSFRLSSDEQPALWPDDDQSLKFGPLAAGQSPMRLTQQMENPRQALVNPIVQSPTMNTIYDNHPGVRGHRLEPDGQRGGNQFQQQIPASYSHYDNHNPLMMVHSPSMGGAGSRRQQQQQSSLRRHRYNQSENGHQLEAHYEREQSFNGLDRSIPLIQPKSNESHGDIAHRHLVAVAATPLRHQRPQSISSHNSSSLTNIVDHQSPIISPLVASDSQQSQETNSAKIQTNGHWRPAAIVSPSMSRQQQHQQQQQDEVPISRHRSPMMSRRMLGQQQTTGHYQQSPLINGQARVLHKPDGVQATISDRSATECRASVASGDPPEVAYEGANSDQVSSSGSSSSGRARRANGARNRNSLVADRLSQSMTCNEDGSNLSLANRDELSSSDSRSVNSSTGNGRGNRQTFVKRSNMADTDLDERVNGNSCSSNDTNPELDGPRRNSQSERIKAKNRKDSRAANRRSSSSSNPSSGGRDISMEPEMVEVEECRWINSKLADEK